jgi:hypothetical protein
MSKVSDCAAVADQGEPAVKGAPAVKGDVSIKNSLFIRISVVIMRTWAPGFVLISPVKSPNEMVSPYFLLNSYIFWFESALMGEQ